MLKHILKFYLKQKQYCIAKKADCENCKLRDFCYSPPSEITDQDIMRVASIIKFECCGSK